MSCKPKFTLNQAVRTLHEQGFPQLTSTIVQIDVNEAIGWIGYRLKDDPLDAWIDEGYLTGVDDASAVSQIVSGR